MPNERISDLPAATLPLTGALQEISAPDGSGGFVSQKITVALPKVYRAVLTVTDDTVNAALVSNVVLENTLGGVPVWAIGSESYLLALAGAFPAGKVFVSASSTVTTMIAVDLSGAPDSVAFATGGGNGSYYVEILVYP